MTLSVCPIAVVDAPAETVWGIVSDPRTYGRWSDAIFDRAVPEGLAQAGQEIQAHSTALGLQFPVQLHVRGVDPVKRILDLTTRAPFGITVNNHITVAQLSAGTCQVSFG